MAVAAAHVFIATLEFRRRHYGPSNPSSEAVPEYALRARDGDRVGVADGVARAGDGVPAARRAAGQRASTPYQQRALILKTSDHSVVGSFHRLRNVGIHDILHVLVEPLSHLVLFFHRTIASRLVLTWVISL